MRIQIQLNKGNVFKNIYVSYNMIRIRYCTLIKKYNVNVYNIYQHKG